MWNRPVTPMMSAKLTARAPVVLPSTSPWMNRSRNSVIVLLPPFEQGPGSQDGEVGAADAELGQLLGLRRGAGGGHLEQAHRARARRVRLGVPGDRPGPVAGAVDALQRRLLDQGGLELGGVLGVAALGQ